MPTTAKYWAEVCIEVQGQRYHAEPDVGISRGGFEDIEAVGLTTEITVKGVTKSVDLFDGVNLNSPDIQRLLANLTAIVDEDAAQDHLWEAA